MSKRTATRARLLRWSSAATASVLAVSSQAHAQLRGVVDVSVRGTAASSPFLEGRSDTGAVAIGLQVDPSIYYEDGETTTAVIRGSAALDQYDADYGTVGSLGVAASVQHRVSARTRVGLNASARSTRSGVGDFLRSPGLPTDFMPVPGPGLPGGPGPDGQANPDPGAPGGFGPGLVDGFDPDFTEAGRRGRTNTYQFGTVLDHSLSPRDSFSLGGSVRFSRSDDAAASDYRADRLTASYRHRISSRTSLNASVAAERADYEEDGPRGRQDGSYVTPTVGISRRLSETVTADLNLGASFTRLDGPDGTITNVGFAGSASICQLQSSGSYCATASRGAQPTSYGGVTSVTSAQISHSRTLGPNDSLQASARYTRRDASLLPVDDGFGAAQSVLAVSAGYNRRIGQRLYAFATPSFARTSGGAVGASRENYQISFGIRYRFGNFE